MKKNKINIMLIVSVFFLVLLISLLVYLLNVIKNKNIHTSVVVATLDKKNIDKENINNLRKKITEFENTNNKIGSYIVDTASIDTFVEFLEKIGVDNKVDLFFNGVDIPKNEKNKISVRLSIKGYFPNIMKTIVSLDNSRYYMNITSSYINKIINDNNQTINGQINQEDTLWQADLVFVVLSK